MKNWRYIEEDVVSYVWFKHSTPIPDELKLITYLFLALETDQLEEETKKNLGNKGKVIVFLILYIFKLKFYF